MSDAPRDGANMHTTSNGSRVSESPALLLTESLMHALVSKGVLSREDFVEIIDVAAEVECNLPTGQPPTQAEATRSRLYPLAAVFRSELQR